MITVTERNEDLQLSQNFQLFRIKSVRLYTEDSEDIIRFNSKTFSKLEDDLIQVSFSNPPQVCVDILAYGSQDGVINEHVYQVVDNIQECAAYCLNNNDQYVYFETLTYEEYEFYDSSCNFGLGCMRNQEARVEKRCWCHEFNDQISCEAAGLSWLNPREDYALEINSGLNPPGRGFRPSGVKGTTYIGPGYCDYESGSGGYQTHTGKTLAECSQLCYDDPRCVVFAWIGSHPNYEAVPLSGSVLEDIYSGVNKCVLADAHCDKGGDRVVYGYEQERYTYTLNGNDEIAKVHAGDIFIMYQRFKMDRGSYVASNMERPSVSLSANIASLPDRVKIKDVVCYANDVCPPE